MRPSTTTTADLRRSSILRDAAFLRLWTGTTASGLATWALPFVLGLAVLDRSLSPAGLGVVLAARTAGFLIAVPLGGVLADRYARRTVVLGAGLTAAAAAPLIALGLGRSTLLMAAAAAVTGAGQGACRPAFQALTAEVVEPDRRQRANAAITLAVRVTTLIAPAATALLATLVDVGALIVGTGLLWLAAALVPPAGGTPVRTAEPAMTPGGLPTASDRRPPAENPAAAPDDEAAGAGGKPAQGKPSASAAGEGRRAGLVGRAVRGFAAHFVDGLQEARRHPWFLAGLAALTAVIATGYSATGVALPLVSRDRYGSEAVLAGALTAYTAGALLGALLIARWHPRNPGWTALAGLACYGFAPLSLLLPLPPMAVVAAYAVVGVGIEVFNVPWFTAVQREVEPSKLARVSSLDFLLSYGLAPVGLALLAPAIAWFGTTVVLGTCALVCLLAPACAALVPTTRRFGRD